VGCVVTDHGYDPARIVALRSRVVESIEALRTITCSDPAAAPALRVAKLMCHNLEQSWLPLVDAIHDSTAMSHWRSSADLARLVTHFGAVSRWIPTAGLDHLPDRHLAEVLVQAAVRFDRAVVEGAGDLTAATAGLRRIAREAARRLDAGAPGSGHEHTFAMVIRDQIGAHGAEQLLAALDSSGELRRFGDAARTDRSTDLVQHAVGRMLGRLAAVDDEVAASLVEHVAMSSTLADVVARDPLSFDPGLLAALAAELVAHVEGVGRWASAPRVIDLASRADALLELVAVHPREALALLGRPDVGEALVTSTRLDADAVEAVVAAGLGSAPTSSSQLMAAGFDALATLVELSSRASLGPGARRGVALAFGTYLPAIAVQLDPALPVVPVLPGTSATTVPLGSYAEVSRLIGQVLDDEPAQLALGVVIGAFRLDQLHAATVAIDQRPHHAVAESRAMLGATLADVGRAVQLLHDARHRHDRLLALEHGMAQARSNQLVSLLGLGVSWMTPAGVPLVRQINSLTTRGLTAAIGTSRPRSTPVTGVDAELAMHATVSAAGVPLRSPQLRGRLGLDEVPDALWHQLDELVTAYDAAADHDSRVACHSRIRQVLSSHPDLDAYAEDTRLRAG
jgi:hypothetical protein